MPGFGGQGFGLEEMLRRRKMMEMWRMRQQQGGRGFRPMGQPPVPGATQVPNGNWGVPGVGGPTPTGPVSSPMQRPSMAGFGGPARSQLNPIANGSSAMGNILNTNYTSTQPQRGLQPLPNMFNRGY